MSRTFRISTFVIIAFFLVQSFAPRSLNNLLEIPLRVNGQGAAEAAVVHGSGLGKHGEIRIYAAERLDCALAAVRSGRVHHIILSGGTHRAGATEAVAMHNYLIACGVDSTVLLVEPDSKNTWENAVQSDSILRANNWGAPLIITSPFHSRRAQMVWQHLRHESELHVAIPARSWVTSSPRFADRWGGLFILGREYVALLKYWLQGRLAT